MRMGDIDRGQSLSGGGDPVGELRGLRIGQESIDEKRIRSAVYQGRRVRDPFQIIVCTENLSSGVVVMKSAQDGA